jgi:hypothetical protein
MRTNGPSNLLHAAANATNDIRGIKPPVEIPNEWAWLWWTLAAALLITVALASWLLLRKKMAQPPPLAIPAHVRAKQKLAEALAFIGDPNPFCTAVSNTIRLYLEERFDLRAPERTTEEFLIELRSSRHLTPDQKQSLGAFLESCDLVKFARFEPTEASLRELHDAALRLVDETQFDSLTTPVTPGMPPLQRESPSAALTGKS